MRRDTGFAGQIVVITGASRGLGSQLAVQLAALGAHLVLIARTVGGLEAADDVIRAAGGSATLVPLDLHDSDGIKRLGAALQQRWGKLDLLIGNAAHFDSLTPLAHLSEKAWDETLAISLSANWRLLRSLDPLLRHAGQSAVVFITTPQQRLVQPYWGGYNVAKAGLEVLAETYARESWMSGVRTLLFRPPPMDTALLRRAQPEGKVQDSAPIEDVAAALIRCAANLPEARSGGAWHADYVASMADGYRYRTHETIPA